MNITFICIGKLKTSCDSLYCNLHFIMVMRNKPHILRYARNLVKTVTGLSTSSPAPYLALLFLLEKERSIYNLLIY